MAPLRVRVHWLLGVTAAIGLLSTAAAAAPAPARHRPSTWPPSVRFTERVISTSTIAGGYPGRRPAPGHCVAGPYDANFSETALALRPGTEDLVGGSKAYFARWSTYRAYHTVSFPIERGRAKTTHIVNGFDCATTGTQAMPPSWSNVTDPNLVFDTRGRVSQLVLAFNAYWGSIEQPNGNVYGVFSDDGGRTWVKGQRGAPVEAGPALSTASDDYLDKPWVTANQHRDSRWRDHLYGAWVEFDGDRAEIHTSVSRDRGRTWTTPLIVPTPTRLGPANPWPIIAVGARGSVYLAYVTYGSGDAATLWTARSVNDGMSWTGFVRVARTTVNRSCCLPGTRVHDGVVEYLATSPDQPGHLYLTWEELRAGRLHVRLTRSTDGGRTWSPAIRVDDAAGPSDAFQPQVAAGPRGAIAVAFYDKRLPCPDAPAILAANRGKANTCISVRVQGYADDSHGLRPRQSNVLLSRHPWDPEQPGQTRGGIGQLACEQVADPCPEIFIGDFFGVQMSARRVYVLSTSTWYPSRVRGDDGRLLHYQRQLLASARRAALGM